MPGTARIMQSEQAQLSLTNRLTLVHADVPCCAVKTAIYWPDFPLPTPLRFDTLNERDLLELPSSYLVWKN